MQTLSQVMRMAKEASVRSPHLVYYVSGVLAMYDDSEFSGVLQYGFNTSPRIGTIAAWKDGAQMPIHVCRLSVQVPASLPVITDLAGTPVPATGGK